MRKRLKKKLAKKQLAKNKLLSSEMIPFDSVKVAKKFQGMSVVRDLTYSVRKHYVDEK